MIDGINDAKVTEWLQGIIPDLKAPIEFSLITGGHSNLTFMCRDANGEAYVLRRPPLGHVLESAHDMGREHKIIHALQDADVPVPKTWGLCQDVEVNDAPFYVMGYVEGKVLNDSQVGATVPEADRRGIGLDVMAILSRLHSINPDDVA
ncbi:MAG: phosphotransferase family protein, partial [Pseudomonadales bacterium]